MQKFAIKPKHQCFLSFFNCLAYWEFRSFLCMLLYLATWFSAIMEFWSALQYDNLQHFFIHFRLLPNIFPLLNIWYLKNNTSLSLFTCYNTFTTGIINWNKEGYVLPFCTIVLKDFCYKRAYYFIFFSTELHTETNVWKYSKFCHLFAQHAEILA